MTYEPNEVEKQEYLAYHSERDFFNNLDRGLNEIEKYSFFRKRKKVALISGAMVAFDKGTINFLNKIIENDNKTQYILLSEVTAENRRKTRETIKCDSICTPHLLAKEILVPYMNITVPNKVTVYIKKKKYLKKAIENLKRRHRNNIGQGYAEVLMYYADRYIRKVLDIIEPDCVWLWNEFYAFHMVFQNICKRKHIDTMYMEFGCIPGTYVIEKTGQQGESFPSRKSKQFNKLEITEEDCLNARKIIKYIYNNNLNRNIQPPYGNIEKIVSRKAGSPIIVYMGQNDYESGMYPYTYKTRRFHSPVFKSTLEGLEYLNLLAIKNGWILLYKPHPIMEILENDNVQNMTIERLKNVNIHEVIDYSDVILTILSQSAYIALIRGKPVVMLGYTQLRNSGCIYEAYRKKEIELKIISALEKRYTKEQRINFNMHMARMMKYCLFDSMRHPDFEFGKKISEEVYF